MNARKFNVETDYPILLRWWESHGHGVLAPEFLPETGVTVLEDNRMIACSWLYFTNSKCAIIDWTIVNPEAGLMQRARAVKLAMEQLQELARAGGVGVIFGFSGSRGFTKTMLRLGYYKEPRVCDVLVKQLG